MTPIRVEPAAHLSIQDVRLSDLLTRAEHPGVRLLDAAAARSGTDRLLYRASRDVIVRPVPGEEDWHCDRVHYAAGRLPGGEPVRSIGHWNRDGQIEVFQVLTGRVAILCALFDVPEHVFVTEYGPGDLCVVPPRAYHLTYSPWRRSLVTNIYQNASEVGDEHRKYQGPDAPPFLLRRTRSGLSVEAAGPVTVQSRPLCPPSCSLPSGVEGLLLDGSDEDLRRLRTRIEAAYAEGWPL